MFIDRKLQDRSFDPVVVPAIALPCFPQVKNVGPVTSWKQDNSGIEGKQLELFLK